jgi:hypothetical protein
MRLQAWVCDVSEEELRIVEKMKTSYVLMKHISETKRGVPLQKYLSTKGDYPVIGGKNLCRYGYYGVKGFLLGKYLAGNKKLLFLNQPKIISQRLVAHIQNPYPHVLIISAYDQIGNILNVDTVENTVLNNRDYDYRYILALLNSKFISWYAYKFIFCSAIRTMDFDGYYIGRIPIPNAANTNQNPLINLVDQILAITKDEDYLTNPAKQAKVKDLERQIDQMVYKLYDLTPEEIAVVEGKK